MEWIFAGGKAFAWAKPDYSVGSELYEKKAKEESPNSKERRKRKTQERKKPGLGSFGLVTGGAAFVVGEVALTQSNVLRGHLDQFIIFDEFQGEF